MLLYWSDFACVQRIVSAFGLEQIYRQANTSFPQHISWKAKPNCVLGGLHPRLARATNPLQQCPHRDPEKLSAHWHPTWCPHKDLFKLTALDLVHIWPCIWMVSPESCDPHAFERLLAPSEFPKMPCSLLLKVWVWAYWTPSQLWTKSEKRFFKCLSYISDHKYCPRLFCLKSRMES